MLLKSILLYTLIYAVPLALIGTINYCVDSHQNSLPPTPAKQDASFRIVSD